MFQWCNGMINTAQTCVFTLCLHASNAPVVHLMWHTMRAGCRPTRIFYHRGFWQQGCEAILSGEILTLKMVEIHILGKCFWTWTHQFWNCRFMFGRCNCWFEALCKSSEAWILIGAILSQPFQSHLWKVFYHFKIEVFLQFDYPRYDIWTKSLILDWRISLKLFCKNIFHKVTTVFSIDSVMVLEYMPFWAFLHCLFCIIVLWSVTKWR